METETIYPFTKYLWTPEDEFLSKASRIAEAEEMANGVSRVEKQSKPNNYQYKAIYGIVSTIAKLTNEKHLCSSLGETAGLCIVLNGDEMKDWDTEIWKVLRSPQLNRDKMSELSEHELADVFISLNEHRELWTEGREESASKYFR